MYTPDHYKNADIEQIKGFLRQHSFGLLITTCDGKPQATHLPLELDTDAEGKTVLVGHMARANPQWKSFDQNEQVLCIFNGPHSYVSSSWYAEEEVPTWNYIAVHVYGSIRILDEKAVLASLHKLVDKYEEHSKEPVSLSGMSPKTLRQIKGVVGFQIQMDDIQATYKLSQGREHDHPKIIAELEERADAGSKAIAKCMRKG